LIDCTSKHDDSCDDVAIAATPSNDNDTNSAESVSTADDERADETDGDSNIGTATLG
jgi:hypothetical protein